MLTKLEKFNTLTRLLIHGLLIVGALIILQTVLNNTKEAFMMFLPPLGFIFFYMTTYLIGPIAVGAINILIIHKLYKLKGWQVGIWLNGFFLVLAFTTINLILQTMTHLPFSPYIAVIDLFLLSLPFGIIARYSNGGWNKPIN